MFDEAQYWSWSSHLAFGYYSKPPLIAWIISGVTTFFGDSEPTIRSISVVAHFVTAYGIYALSSLLCNRFDGSSNLLRKQNHEIVPILACLSYITLPAVSYSSLFISTDPLLMAFWVWSLIFLVRINRQPACRLYWVSTGALLGFGIMAKYTMLLFLPCNLIFRLFRGQGPLTITKHHVLLISTCLIIVIPNIYWNVENHFVTLSHTIDLGTPKHVAVHWAKLSKFITEQILLFGPVFFAIFFIQIFNGLKCLKRRTDDCLLWCFSVPVFLIFVILALITGAHGNWAIVCYLTATIYVVVTLERLRYGLLILSIGIFINCVLGLVVTFPSQALSLAGIELTYENDLHFRNRGQKIIADEIRSFRVNRDTRLPLYVDTRKLIAPIIYYLKPENRDVYAWDGNLEIDSYYEMMRPMELKEGDDIIFLTQREEFSDVSSYFSETTLKKTITPEIYRTNRISYSLYLLEDYSPRSPKMVAE